MSFAIIRQEKITELKGIKAHNEREYIPENANPKLTSKNITLTKNKYKSTKDYLESTRLRISNHNKKHKTKHRNVQQDKKFSQEYIFTHSPGAMSEQESIEYLKLADQFLRDRFKNLEVLGSYIHLDEKTPHLHFDISFFDLNQNKFVQRDLGKNKITDIEDIRNAWQNYIEDKGYNLRKQDGSVVAAQLHQSKANKEIDELKQKLKQKPKKEIVEVVKEIEVDNSDKIREKLINWTKHTLKIDCSKESWWKGIEKTLTNQRETILNQKEDISSLKNDLSLSEQNMSDLEQQIELMKIEIDKLKNENQNLEYKLTELEDINSLAKNEGEAHERSEQISSIVDEFIEQSEHMSEDELNEIL